jgi:hypothetical protein
MGPHSLERGNADYYKRKAASVGASMGPYSLERGNTSAARLKLKGISSAMVRDFRNQ